MTTKSKISDREITAANQELQKIQCDNKNLDSVRFAQERKITELTFKLESIERSLGDKESLISSSKILASSADEQKVMCICKISLRKFRNLHYSKI